jgi:YVTN family beta-propeller protein
MRPDLRNLLFLSLAMAVFASTRHASAQTTIPAGNTPVAVAINTVTNKVYVANEFSDNVTIIDGSNNTTRTVAVCRRPQYIAVNSKTNKVFVNCGTDSSLAVIDGATLAVTATLPIGSNGPIAVDEAFNKVYVVRAGGNDEVTFVDGATNTWYSIATDGYWPLNQALDSAGRRLYVTAYASGEVRAVDLTSTSDHPPTVPMGVWSKPVFIALNTNTKRAYVTGEDPRGPITVLNTVDRTGVSFAPAGHAVGPRGVAVNAATNKVYAAFNNEVIVMDGATNALTFLPASTPVALAINPNNNKIYAPAADGSMAIINGATNAVTRAGIPAGARAVAVNPTTGRVYVVGPQVTMLEGGAAPPPPPSNPPPSNPPPATEPVASVNAQGLWWASPGGVESGWGINFAQQGDVLFGTWFTYDTDGSGLWLVMSNGKRTSANTYTGDLYRTSGPAFSAAPFNPAQVQRVRVGSATVTFSDANTGRLAATVSGVTLDKPITRQVFAAPQPTCVAGGAAGSLPNYTDLWWASPANSESGWGVNVSHQGDILFVTWFTYGSNGRGMWLVGSNVARTGNGTYAGTLQRTTGPAFNASPWNPSQVGRSDAGTISFSFSDANNGVMSYDVGGVRQSKNITRQVFATPATVCR